MNAAFAAFKGISALKGAALGFVAVGAALLTTIAPAVRFEAAFANVAKTVDATPDQLIRLRGSILDMSREMPLAADGIAQVAATAGQLGVRVGDIEVFTRTMIQLGTATDLTADQAATALARFTNIMVIPARQLPLLAAGLVELGNNSAATESEILNLGLRLAGAGQQLGLSGQQVLALSASMKSLGITAEAGGSSVSRVMIDMVTAAGPRLDTFAKTIGITSDEFRRLVSERSPEAAAKLIVGFVEGLNRVDKSGGSVRQVLKDLGLDSIRLRDALFRLTGGSQEVVKAFGLIAQESQYGSALLDEYGRFAETTSSRLQILRNRITALSIDIGTPLLGGIVAVLDGFGDGIVRLNQLLAPAGNDIREFVSALGEVGGVIATTFGPAVLGVAQGAILATADALGGLLSVLSAGGGFGLAGLAIAALAADLLLVGPASVAAANAFRLLAVQLGTVAVTYRSIGGVLIAVNTQIAVGATIMRAALLAAPWAALAAGAYLYYDALRGVREAAQEAGDSVRNSLNRALEANDAEGFARAIGHTRDQILKLNNAASETETRFGSFWGKAIDLRSQVLFGDRLDESTQKVREMQKALDEVEAERLSAGFNEIARILGITSGEVAAAAAELDLYEDVVKAGEVALNGFNLGLNENSIAFTGVTDAIQDHIMVSKSLEDGSLTAYTERLGISFRELILLAAEAGISMDDLTDPKRYEENVRAIAPLIDKYQELADASGLSREGAQAESLALASLIGQYQQLVKAIDDARAAREAGVGQEQNLEKAAQDYARIREEFVAGAASAEDYAKATFNLEAAIATSGLTAEQAAVQNAILADEFVATARQAGVAETEIAKLLVNWVALSATEAAKFEITGMETLALAQERVASLKIQLAAPIVAEMALEFGTTVEDMQNLIDRGNTWATAEFKARMEAAIEQPLEAFARIMLDAGIWDATEAEAFLLLNIDSAEANRQRVEENLRAMTEGRWTAILDADGTPADLRVAGAVASATGFATGTYNAKIEATDLASPTIAKPQRFADDYRAGVYNAKIEATDLASPAIAKPQRGADTFVSKGPYRPTIGVTDQATGTINRIQSAVDNMRGKTITVTVRNLQLGVSATNAPRPSTSGRGNLREAEGGIVRSYAGGGFENHQAMIAPGRWPVRIWAEPETGGEAYIPLSQGKRARSTRILDIVAREFGFALAPMAAGGLFRQSPVSAGIAPVVYAQGNQTAITVNAPIAIDITAPPGTDVQTLAGVVDTRVRAAFRSLTRELANQR